MAPCWWGRWADWSWGCAWGWGRGRAPRAGSFGRWGRARPGIGRRERPEPRSARPVAKPWQSWCWRLRRVWATWTRKEWTSWKRASVGCRDGWLLFETEIQLPDMLPIILNCEIGIMNWSCWVKKKRFSATYYQLPRQKYVAISIYTTY